MPMTRCFFCRRKIGKRKRGKLIYEDVYARNNLGFIVCIDCLKAIEESILKIHIRRSPQDFRSCHECKVRPDLYAPYDHFSKRCPYLKEEIKGCFIYKGGSVGQL